MKAQIKQAFPQLTDDEINTIIPNKEEMSFMKIETHSGEVVTAHCLGKKPIVFHIRDAFFPTIYLLWMFPKESLPSFTTWYVVVPKFQNGADLMLPGIIIDEKVGLRAYGRLKKGETVAVNTNQNAAAVAVGRTALSSEDMYMAGRRGKGVEILHCIGDKLWELGGKESPPQWGPPAVMQSANNEEEASQEMTEQSDEAQATIPEDDTKPESSVDQQPVGEETESNADEATEGIAEGESETQKSPQELMDELVEYCFLKALKTSAKKIELPVLTSNFFRLHMVPACPSDKSLDVKKSSYKKLSKFLDLMKKEGVLVVKELTKGVESITDINHGHDRIRQFKLQEESCERKSDPLETVKEVGKYLPPVITPLFLVNANTLALFSSGRYRYVLQSKFLFIGMWSLRFFFRKGSSLRAQEVRSFLTDYVKQNNLQDESSKRSVDRWVPSVICFLKIHHLCSQVKLDPILSDVALKKGENELKMSWEELMSRVMSKLSPAYEMVFPDGAEPIILKGQLEPVEISTASRAGNKKVTLISGLETFRIDLEQFAHR